MNSKIRQKVLGYLMFVLINFYVFFCGFGTGNFEHFDATSMCRFTE